MGTVKRIAPIFGVRDLGAALAHYQRLRFATREYEGGGYGFATRDGVEIHLGVVAEPDAQTTRSAAYLWVDDADQLAQEWLSAGAEVQLPQDTDWGQHEGAHVDPDGNVIRFGSPVKPGRGNLENKMVLAGRLRIVTLNLWNRNHWDERRESVVSWITELDPDVIGFQEVVRSDSSCQATWLGEQTGLNAESGGFPTSDGSLFGNATLSRFPIVESESMELPGLGRSDERRLCLRTALDTPRGVIQFFNTHLNYLFDDGVVREAQVAAISRFIRGASRAGHCPPILVGDFNAVPGSTEIRFLKGLTSLAGESFHLFDSFEVVNPMIHGPTWDNTNSYAAANRVPDQRIDYIFVGVRAADGTGQILDSQVVFNRPAGKTWPSDHFGVVTDIVFAPKAG